MDSSAEDIGIGLEPEGERREEDTEEAKVRCSRGGRGDTGGEGWRWSQSRCEAEEGLRAPTTAPQQRGPRHHAAATGGEEEDQEVDWRTEANI